MTSLTSVSVTDYLDFSELAYDLNDGGQLTATPPAGWTSIATPGSDDSQGLTYDVFENVQEQKIVIAYRGTYSTHDLATDIQLGFQRTLPIEFAKALSVAAAFVQQTKSSLSPYDNFSVSVTGHSLGGAEAQFVAANLDIGGVTFAAPGVARYVSTPPADINNTANSILTNYVIQTDGIAELTGKNVGYTVTLSPPLLLSSEFLLGAVYDPTVAGLLLGGAEFALRSHLLSSYGDALAEAGIISANPVGVSPASPFDITSIYKNATGFTSGTDSLGNAYESATVIDNTTAGTATTTIKETLSPAGDWTLSVDANSAGNTIAQLASWDAEGGLQSNQISMDGETLTTQMGQTADVNVAADGSLLVGIASSAPGAELTFATAPNGAQTIQLGGDATDPAVEVAAFAPGSTAGDSITVSSSNKTIDLMTKIDLGSLEVTETASAANFNQAFSFIGAGDVLKIDDTVGFKGVIANFVKNETIDLADLGIGFHSLNYDPATQSLTIVRLDNKTVVLPFSNNISDFIVKSDGAMGAILTTDTVETISQVISGLTASQSVAEGNSGSPFAGVTITDPNTGQTETATVTLSAAGNGTLSNLGSGAYDAIGGVYTVSGTPGAITTALRGLVFTPTNLAPPGGSFITGLAVTITDTTGASFSSSGATVTTGDPAATVSDWQNVSGDWATAGDWSMGTPNGPTADAAIDHVGTFPGSYNVTIGTGESFTVGTLEIGDAKATLEVDGNLTLGKTAILNAGTLAFIGTIHGGRIDLAGGILLPQGVIQGGAGFDFSGAGSLDGVTLEGTFDVASGVTSITNGLKLLAADGVSPGTMIIGNAMFGFIGSQTLDNGNIVIGFGDKYSTYDGGTFYHSSIITSGSGFTPATITFGANFRISSVGNVEIGDYYSGGEASYSESVQNDGVINADTNNAIFTIEGKDVSNVGTINVNNGDALTILASDPQAAINTFTNAAGASINVGNGSSADISGQTADNLGAITATAGATLTLSASASGGGGFENAGVISATGATITLMGQWIELGALNIAHSSVTLGGAFGGGFSLAEALPPHVSAATLLFSQFDNQTDTVTVAKDTTLDNSGATLRVGAGSGLSAITLAGGISGGVIADGGSGFVFAGGTLSNIYYEGNLDLTAANSRLALANGITLTGSGGSGPGRINLTGQNSALLITDNETLDNATIIAGNAGGADAITLSDPNRIGLTLTLGTHLNLVEAGAGGQFVLGEAKAVGATSVENVVNDGAIAVANGGTLTVNTDSFTNIGTIAGGGTLSLAGGGTSFDAGASLTVAQVVQFGTVTIETNLAYSRTWTQTAGTLLVASGDRLTFNGPGDSFAGTIAGAGTVAFTGGSVVLDAASLSIADTVINGATATLSGMVVNSGTIVANTANLIVGKSAAGSAGLTGGGTVVLSNSSSNRLYGAGSGVELRNINNRILGAGHLGNGQMILANAAGGVINGDDSNALIIDTGANTILNSGIIAATGSGGVVIQSAIFNNNALAASGGNLTINGAVTGNGTIRISNGVADFTSSLTQTVFFGATGTLKLAQSQGYTGKIYGFSKTGATELDLSDIAFVGGTTKATFSGTTASGVLTVTDGTHTAHIILRGNYTTSTFIASSDGHGGTKIVDPPAAPHLFIGAMAGFGAAGYGGSTIHALDASSGGTLTLLAPRTLPA